MDSTAAYEIGTKGTSSIKSCRTVLTNNARKMRDERSIFTMRTKQFHPDQISQSLSNPKTSAMCSNR